MMDLAEIRKKARKGSARDGEGGRSASSIQGAPPSAPQVPLHGPAPSEPLPPISSTAEPAAVDPLDDLFSSSVDLGLATEEAYLEGLMEREREHDDHDQRQCLAFELGSEEYALDIANIREIIKPREVTNVPRVADFILGVISLRGVIIPVFDLKRRLNLGEAEVTPESRIIVCHHGDRSAGLLVDRLNQVVRIPGPEIEPPPAVLSGLDREMVEGVGRYRGRMLILLELSHVLSADIT